jgi:uncharacterized membrane protein YgcG
MALLADGWHMASHTLSLFLSLVVYYLYRHPKFRASFTFGGGKILSLGGYTSALFLVLIAGSMIIESIKHFYDNEPIHYNEALVVAAIGLFVNLVCAMILHQGHPEETEGTFQKRQHDDHAHCNHDHDHGHSHKVNKLAPKTAAHSHSHGHSHSHSHSRSRPESGGSARSGSSGGGFGGFGSGGGQAGRFAVVASAALGHQLLLLLLQFYRLILFFLSKAFLFF